MLRRSLIASAAALLLTTMSVHGAFAAAVFDGLGAYSKEGSGVYNATTYSFKAKGAGDIRAYFTGADAGYTSEIGMLVNGVSTGVFGLNNHTASFGQMLDLGHVNAGDTIVFALKIDSLGGKLLFSDPSMNLAFDRAVASGSIDGHNHIYSTAYTGQPVFAGVPNGTYVAFEDQSFPKSNYDYNDETFVFTDVTNTPVGGVPEPATWAMMLTGIGGVGAAMRRSRRKQFGAVASA